MPTDAELRRLFHDAPSPTTTIDLDVVIRRSKRRRLPQQLGAGGVLTLAAAGISVASINGLQLLAPMGAADLADAPTGVSEESPFSGAESVPPARDNSCATDAVTDADAQLQTGLEVVPHFPGAAELDQPVVGTITLTNTGTETVSGEVLSPLVTLSRDGVQVRHEAGPAEIRVALAPGESVTLDFSFDAVDCDRPGDTDGDALQPGQYELTAMLTLSPDSGPIRTIGGPPSAITLR